MRIKKIMTAIAGIMIVLGLNAIATAIDNPEVYEKPLPEPVPVVQLEINDHIDKMAKRYGLNPDVIKALIEEESGCTEIIMEESQERANEEVSRRCICAGAEIEDKRKKLAQAIKEISRADELLNLKELDLEQTRLILNIGNMVIDEKVDKASITLQGSTITVRGGDKIKVQRNAKTTTSKEV